MKLVLQVCAAVAVAIYLPGRVDAQTPTGTTFTYQGQLRSGGSPVTDPSVPMSFALYDAATIGTQVGGTLMFDGVGENPAPLSVTNGLFTVQLDFGSGVFDGNARWLEVAVNGMTLLPRQELTATPYAQTASLAQSCNYANAPWIPSGADLYYMGGNVGIGTSGPAAALDVAGTVKMDGFLMATGAAAGKVLTSDGSGNGTWQTDAGLTLPYSGTASVNGSNLFALDNTGTGNGLSVQVESTLATATAILGTVSSSTPGGSSAGVRGVNNGTGSSGIGVWGSHSGGGYGVYGVANGPSGTGVLGSATALTGFGFGLYGSCYSTSGYGVYGWSPGNGVVGASSSSGYGVYGSSQGTGTYGTSTASTGQVTGVAGFIDSTTAGNGVHGWAYASTGDTRGVTGLNYSTGGIGVLGSEEATSGATVGVLGQCSSPNGDGVSGRVTTGTSNAGVHGVSYAANGNGIIAEATNGTAAYALWAKASQGIGVRCDGALQVSGTKSFRIDHPLDPENKYLLHYCAESPEPLNTYTGNVTTDAAGYANVALPDYFEEINRDFRYQLTVVDDSEDFVLAKVARGVSENSFQIRTNKPNVNVSWMVIATRNDRYVRTYGAPVEIQKPASEQGTYQDPSLYGQPAEKAQGYRPHSEGAMMRDAGSGSRADAAPRIPAAPDAPSVVGATSAANSSTTEGQP